MLLFKRCALGYGMGPGARPVILPVTAPRNRAREYLRKRPNRAKNIKDRSVFKFASVRLAVFTLLSSIVPLTYAVIYPDVYSLTPKESVWRV